MEIYEIIKELTEENGVTGDEIKPCKKAASFLEKTCEKVEIDNFNNVIAVFCEKPNAKTVLLDAHIDEIGLIVTAITKDGFLKISNCGGVDTRGLIGKEISVLGKRSITGIICSIPPHISSGDEKIPQITELSVDIGFSKKEAEKIVSLGDRCCFKIKTEKLLNSFVTGKSMDDRAGCASLILACEKLDKNRLNCSVIINLSSQEEISAAGSQISCYKINPDLAIAVDVSFAKTPDSPKFKCGNISEGVMIGISPSLDKTMSENLIKTAKEKNILFQLEIMGSKTGTNCDKISVSRNGVKTALLSIPQKYMHSNIEVCDLNDIEAVSNLICEYLYSL